MDFIVCKLCQFHPFAIEMEIQIRNIKKKNNNNNNKINK